MVTRESIGSRLAQLRREKAARERRDIPQTIAADELGASAAGYSRWESDLRRPNEEWLGKLARYYGTTVPFIHYGVVDARNPASPSAGSVEPDPSLDYKFTDEDRARDEAVVAARKSAKAAKHPRKRA